MAHAAKTVLVTVERMTGTNLLEDERLAPGAISAAYIDAVAVAERGAWPAGLLDEYGADAAHIAEYARLARTGAGFRAYLGRYVLNTPARPRMIRPEERLAAALARLIQDPAAPPARHVAVGAASPVPAAACWLAKHRARTSACRSCTRAAATPSPRARASCSTWPGKGASTCSFWVAARSTGRRTST